MMVGTRISVLYFTNVPIRGGAEEHILTLLRGLDRQYFRLSLVCPPKLAERLQPDLPDDVRLIPLCLGRPTQLGAALRFARIVRELHVDILHSHMFYSSLFASPIGALCRVPVIVETPHVREHWRRGWLKSRFFADRVIGGLVHHYIAVSEANARYLVEQKRLPPRKVVLIRNGIDLQRFHPARPEPGELRQSLGFEPGDPVLLVLGRLEPQKGHRVLLEALPVIRSRFPRVRLVCVGEGILRDELVRQTHALGLESAVRFVGYQSNVADWLTLADLSVLPSFFEGLPLAAIESLAAGRTVVATAVDGTPEVVVDMKTGLTVPPGDAARLADAICRLLHDAELRRRLASAGCQWVIENFSHAQQIEKTQQLYLSAWEQCAHGRTSRVKVAENQPAVRRTRASLSEEPQKSP